MAGRCSDRSSFVNDGHEFRPLPLLRRRAAVRSRPRRARYRFRQGSDLLGRPCRLRARRPRRALCRRRQFTGITRSARSTTRRSFAEPARRRSASALPMPSSWRAGTRSSPARCPASRRCWQRAAKRMPLYAFSNTNPAHVEHFSKAYADVLGHFREIFLSSTIGLRKPDAEAYDHVVKAIGVPAVADRVLRRLRRQYRRRAGTRPDRRSRDIAGRRGKGTCRTRDLERARSSCPWP